MNKGPSGDQRLCEPHAEGPWLPRLIWVKWTVMAFDVDACSIQLRCTATRLDREQFLTFRGDMIQNHVMRGNNIPV
jgi:hypothetical protein